MSTHSNISPTFKAINDLFHQPSSTGFHRLNWVVWLLVLSSICLLFVTLYLGENHPWIPTLDFIDGILIWIFGIEYVLRIASYRPPVLDILTLSKVRTSATQYRRTTDLCRQTTQLDRSHYRIGGHTRIPSPSSFSDAQTVSDHANL